MQMPCLSSSSTMIMEGIVDRKKIIVRGCACITQKTKHEYVSMAYVYYKQLCLMTDDNTAALFYCIETVCCWMAFQQR